MIANAKNITNRISSSYVSELSPGCTLQLQFGSPMQQRVPAKLVGFEMGRYLVVRLFEHESWHRYGNFLYENNEVVVRTLVEDGRGECLAFKTAVRWRSYNPINMLFLYFPDEVEKFDLRSHRRVATCIEASLSDTLKVVGQEEPLKGCIKDVSLGGCCFEFILPPKKLGIAQRPLLIGAGNSMRLTAEVRNQRKSGDSKVSVGLHFQNTVEEIDAALSSLYIASEMLYAR